MRGPVLVVSRLYVPAGKLYGRGRGLASRGKPSRGLIRERERGRLGRLDGRGRELYELYGLIGQLGGVSG